MNYDNLDDILLANQSMFMPVIPFDPGHQQLLLLDFTENNKELTTSVLADLNLFTSYIDQKLLLHNAVYGIGGYAEHRTIYSRSQLFDGLQGDEPRRFHLGIDIWGRALTPVSTPMDAIVHSFAFNNRQGDYGATIILEHKLDGFIFYTLYGHLSYASIKDIREGMVFRKGQPFASLGVPGENGEWPPHLHLQLIKNMQGYKGDYPGVCRFSDRESYLSNCPDPDLVLQMMRYAHL